MDEESIFIKVLGDYPLIRIFNYFLIYRELDYSLTDIADGSEVAWSTLNTLWPNLEKMNIVEQTRTVGKAKMFKLNTKNGMVKEIIRFADRLVWTEAEKETEKKKIIAE